MNRSILVIQHHSAEGPGRIKDWAQQSGVKLDCVMADSFFSPAPTLDQVIEQVIEQVAQQLASRIIKDYLAVVILGGPMNVEDNPQWMAVERQVIARLIAHKQPIIAICLGAQLVASELGATVYALEQAENGWQSVNLISDTPTHLMVPQWHEQGFEFSESQLSEHSLQILASSSACKQQIYQNSHILGIQFHPEWDTQQMHALQQAFSDVCPFNTAELDESELDDNDQYKQNQQQLAHWLFNKLDERLTR
ncbi:type 1 glutamine amidotransferase [Shewanella maritima]|uniref:Type 1 glutamine amidotransferase n=1 Tax=Shewanella maritima TaxID=2520507 RepID=A0A411PH59_9GAMM|nr:type 1 glutamine amidotransferase [Shewanella maritima]QBF82875.1 type 1 glutamine amidotransferase [Shewanella maritima]